MQWLVLNNPIKLTLQQRIKLPRESVRLNWTWEETQMSMICPHIKEWKAKELHAANNQKQPILHQIQLIKFTQLTTLNLSDNRILTIQSLCRIQAPLLCNLFIGNNKVHTLSFLKRGFWTNLSYLEFHNNPIQDHQSFFMCCSSKLEDICFEKHSIDLQNCSNLNSLLKLKSEKLVSLSKIIDNYEEVRSCFRLKNQNRLENVRKRYPFLIAYF